MTDDAHHGLPKKEARYVLVGMGKGRGGEPQACDEGCRWLGGTTGWGGMLGSELMGGSKAPHREFVGSCRFV